MISLAAKSIICLSLAVAPVSLALAQDGDGTDPQETDQDSPVRRLGDSESEEYQLDLTIPQAPDSSSQAASMFDLPDPEQNARMQQLLSALALDPGNQSALAHNKDEFIRYAIEKGRQDTPMPAFETVLAEQDIDNVTAFIRSRADNWTPQDMPLRPLPTPDQYVVNPGSDDPEWELMDGKFINSEQLFAAMQSKKKMILLDTRVPSVWQRAHIEGSIPFPYYMNLAEKVDELPRDVQIVSYCSCPRASAEYIADQLIELGFERTAVLYEGIFGWMNKGFPVTRSE